jgi:hypothetical protein
MKAELGFPKIARKPPISDNDETNSPSQLS